MIETVEAYGLQLLVPAKDDGVASSLRENGEFARVEVELIKALLEGGDFVDVGANVGAIALPTAAFAKRVIAAEASRGLAGLLAANTYQNRLLNVAVRHAAVGETDRLAKFPMAPLSAEGNHGTSGFGQAGRFPEEIICMLTLDRIATPDTRVVKIDVEGYEPSVMTGARAVLETVRPYWIVESATGSPGDLSVIETFRAADYRLYWLYAPFVTRRPNRGTPPAKIRGDLNIVAAPREKPQPEWPMLAVDPSGARPTQARDFPYLTMFGWDFGAA